MVMSQLMKTDFNDTISKVDEKKSEDFVYVYMKKFIRV